MTPEEAIKEDLIMWDFTQAYEKANKLLDNPRIVRFYREEIETMAARLVDVLC